jgi:hypothetical protein
MKSSKETPDVIKEAKRVSRNAALGITAWTLSIFPLTALSNTTLFAGTHSFLFWIAGAAVLAYFTDWTKLSSATTLLEEYRKKTAHNLLESTLGPDPELDADHPLAGIAERVRGLAEGDARVLDVVDTLLVKVREVEHDLASLTAAVEAEQSLGATNEDERIQRLNTVASQKKAVIEKLAGGLRDLHVELTVRKNDDHDALLSQVSNMLDGIAAETEVEQALSEPAVSETASIIQSNDDVERKRTAQRQESQKERT